MKHPQHPIIICGNRLIRCVIALLFVVSAVSQTAVAQSAKKERTLALWGHVRDSFTKAAIKDVKITLMDADSTVIDSCMASYYTGNGSPDANFRFLLPAKTGRFLIRASHPDYEDCYVNYHIQYVARNRFFDAPWHYMKRRMKTQADLDVELGEVTVRATRVKMAYRGDTIVFDASAFQLPDGSMLDALIRQMPGVEMSADGVIKVNGRTVDYLMLNGKDFFKGNNKVMLDNLPYYSVSDVKVYDRMTDKSRYMGKNIDRKEYVMDVNLKREYSIGLMGNGEAAGATENHYMARVFATVFSDLNRLTVYGNVNNINETRSPDGQGNWEPSYAPEGETTVRTAGLSYRTDGKDKWFDNTADLEASWNDDRQNTSTMTQRFLTDMNSYAASDSRMNQRTRSLSFDNTFRLKLPVWLFSRTSFKISDGRASQLIRQATLDRQPGLFGEPTQLLDSIFTDALRPAGDLLNSTYNRLRNNNRELSVYQGFEYNKKLPWGDNLELAVNGTYQHHCTTTDQDYRQNYRSLPADNRLVHASMPSTYYNYYGRAEYYLNLLNNWTCRFYSLYEQNNKEENQPYYRLDRLSGWMPGLHPFGKIPAADSLLLAVSSADSYNYNLMHRRWNPGFNIYYEKSSDATYTWLRFHLPVLYNRDRIHYVKDDVNTADARTRWTVDGNINFKHQWNRLRNSVELHVNHLTILPDMLDYVYFSTTNPLAIWLANPSLKNGGSWHTEAATQLALIGSKLAFSGSANYTYSTNQILTGYRYDTETGGYVYQKRNGKDEWSFGTYLQLLSQLGPWQLGLAASLNANRGQILEMGTETTPDRLYAAKGMTINPRLAVVYQKGLFAAEVRGMLYFSKVNYGTQRDDDYRSRSLYMEMSARYTIPGVDIQLATSADWDRELKTVDAIPLKSSFVWNASVSRAFLKNRRLVAKLTAFDILGNVSSYNYIYGNSTFSYESTERLGRYVMLGLQYNFFHNPKGKK